MSMTTKKDASRLLAIIAALALCLGLAFAVTGCSSGGESSGGDAEQKTAAEATAETVEFTDDLGRTVELPAKIERIAPSWSPDRQPGAAHHGARSDRLGLGNRPVRSRAEILR